MTPSTSTASPARGTAGEVITNIARRSFAEHGFHGVSIRDIALESNLSLSALYHYYPSKHDLLFAIIDTASAGFLSVCTHATEKAGPDAVAQLDALVRAIVEYRADRNVESNLVQMEMRSLTDEQRASIGARQQAVSNLLASIVDTGVSMKLFSMPHPDEARRAILSCCNAISQWYRPEGSLTVDQIATRYIEIARSIVGYRS